MVLQPNEVALPESFLLSGAGDPLFILSILILSKPRILLNNILKP